MSTPNDVLVRQLNNERSEKGRLIKKNTILKDKIIKLEDELRRKQNEKGN